MYATLLRILTTINYVPISLTLKLKQWLQFLNLIKLKV